MIKDMDQKDTHFMPAFVVTVGLTTALTTCKHVVIMLNLQTCRHHPSSIFRVTTRCNSYATMQLVATPIPRQECHQVTVGIETPIDTQDLSLLTPHDS
jgi:hypothetical protein